MDLQLNNRKVIVTGASKGIGRATALAFAQEGATPILVSRDHAKLETVANDIEQQTGIKAEVYATDLATEAGCQNLYEAHAETDILVNNAGAVPGGALSELSMDQWRAGWELKVFGYINLCKRYSTGMYARGSGVIINIIGMGGRAVRPHYICGAAANAALIGFTQALGAESAQHGVRAVGINPSPTATDRMIGLAKTRAAGELGDEARWEEILDGSKFPFGRLKKPEEVANLAVMLSSPEVTYLSGTVIDMDGGLQWT